MCRGPEAESRLRASRIPALLLRHRCSGRRRCPPHWWRAVSGVCCVTRACGPVLLLLAVLPVFWAPSDPLTVRAASFARRVGSKPGQALRPRRCPPHWWRVVRVAWPGPPHVQPSHPLNAEHPTNFACNSLVTISNLEFAALELQRFPTLLNLRPIELHATFGGALAVRWRSSHW